jgi:hypothetical protein
MVWNGGATTPSEGPVTVGAFTALSAAAAMEQPILPLCTAGHGAAALAMPLTQQGYRSPTRPQVLPSPVKPRRLPQGVLPPRHPSHPRRRAGGLPVPQRARAVAVTPQWGYQRSKRGAVASPRDPTTGLSLLPDGPETRPCLRPLREERLRQGPCCSRRDLAE